MSPVFGSRFRFRFPYFGEPVAEDAIAPPSWEVKAVAQHLDCEVQVATLVALHRRVIQAMTEAEETADLRHVADLVALVVQGQVFDAALPADFHKRLLVLYYDLQTRARGQPRRSEYLKRDVYHRLAFYRAAAANGKLDDFGKPLTMAEVEEWAADEFGVSESRIRQLAEEGKEANELLPRVVNYWDRNFERFFIWTEQLSTPAPPDPAT